jgi:alpha,alpha-trehalase
MLDAQKYRDCLSYIRNYWDKLICYQPKDKQLHLGLPEKYVVANHEIFDKDQFYWDSYFIIVGLVRAGKIGLARGMVNNFVFLYKRFGIIPMRNRYYNLGTSQIPFLTSMIFEVHNAEPNKSWLKKVIRVAEDELKNYWMNAKRTERHLSYKGLSRYCDHYITHLGAEHESGWDMTSRFNDRCLEYLPIDLNCCLYKYERDIARACALLGDKKKSAQFETQAAKRRKTIRSLMWNEKSRFYFDYNYPHKKQSTFMSVAGFYPLWAGIASKKQASLIRKYALPALEYEGGVANTRPDNLSRDIKQHDYPNGWPQQQWIVIKGLLNYGYAADAFRIAAKWLDMNAHLYHETGKFWEKHNVVNCTIGVYNPERYVTQSGFGWTNAVFVRLVDEFSAKQRVAQRKKRTAKKKVR